MIYITFSIQISVRVSPPQITGGGFHRFSISATSDINTELSRPAENTLHIWIFMILQFLKVSGCCFYFSKASEVILSESDRKTTYPVRK